jgi:hypothetical protein
VIATVGAIGGDESTTALSVSRDIGTDRGGRL